MVAAVTVASVAVALVVVVVVVVVAVRWQWRRRRWSAAVECTLLSPTVYVENWRAGGSSPPVALGGAWWLEPVPAGLEREAAKNPPNFSSLLVYTRARASFYAVVIRTGPGSSLTNPRAVLGVRI